MSLKAWSPQFATQTQVVVGRPCEMASEKSIVTVGLPHGKVWLHGTEWGPAVRKVTKYNKVVVFKYFSIITPKFGEDEPNLTSMFFKGVETTN